MQFSFYGHSCFSLENDKYNFLFDPFITPNDLAKGIDIKDLNPDYIFISHGHEDHIADAVAIAKQSNATIICNFEIATWLGKNGCEKIHPMNFGTKEFDFGTVHFVPAQHSSALPDGTYGGNPGGFIIKLEDKNIYFSGDTCLTFEMQFVPKYANIDVAILPIGGNFTMNAQEAIWANEMIGASKIIGVHFDTFGYILIDHQATKELFAKNNIDFLLPEIGNDYII